MEKTLVPQKTKIGWLILFWVIIISIWIASGLLLRGDENRGTFGDMFGAVNALFSGLAFATLIYTAWMQRDELALQREELSATRAELEGQKLQLTEQTATFALQRFEDSFFALLRMHGEIVDAMDLVEQGGKITRSRDCFKIWYRRLLIRHKVMSRESHENPLQLIRAVYNDFYVEHQAEIGHYFRHLYHIIKFVKDSKIEDKRKYTSLVRAQLSGYEHVLLFYNCISDLGQNKFKPLVEEFSLLENMPQSELIAREFHIDFYHSSAYGEDARKYLG